MNGKNGNNRRTVFGLLIAFSLLASAYGGSLLSSRSGYDQSPVHMMKAEPDLAVLMGELQRLGQKLGYSIAGRNERLTDFYLHEVQETVEGIEENVVEHDGLPIGETMSIILDPLLADLEAGEQGGDWPAIEEAYAALINGCNRCHAATEHEFIEITVPSGPAPYNQKF